VAGRYQHTVLDIDAQLVRVGDGGLGLVDLGPGRLEGGVADLQLGNHSLVRQPAGGFRRDQIALAIGLAVPELHIGFPLGDRGNGRGLGVLGFLDLGFRLPQLGLERTRIHASEDLVHFDQVAFAHQDGIDAGLVLGGDVHLGGLEPAVGESEALGHVVALPFFPEVGDSRGEVGPRVLVPGVDAADSQEG
jgi:hypothetical protein